MIISIPSKTFLIGEYAVMDKSPAILVNTLPRFSFNLKVKSNLKRKTFSTQTNLSQMKSNILKLVKKPDENLINIENQKILDKFHSIFHPESLSALWIKKNIDLFSNVSITSSNPHKNKRGFGLSSAEFICVYLWSHLKNGCTLEDIDLHETWTHYRNLSHGQNAIPSGADVLSQWVGGVCLFSSQPFNVRSLTWPIWDLSFTLIRTGDDLKTWKHLKDLRETTFPKLKKYASQAFDAIEKKDMDLFIKLINNYESTLRQNNLVAPVTSEMLKKLKQNKNILAAKGCGAMGAEVVCVFFNKNKQNEILESLKDYEIVGGDQSLTHGVDIEKEKFLTEGT